MESVLDNPQFMDQAFSLIQFYRENPELAAYDLLSVDLSPVQQIILRDMWFKNYLIAIMGRGSGKTFLLAVLACLKALLYPGHRVGLLAPTFRQSKMIFDECDKLWQRSAILQAATEKQPTIASDNCYMRFKAYGGRNASIVQGIPLGDGTKIRGSRFYTIVCDEFPHIPSDIFNMVIRPMGATASNPMERVRHLERQKQLLEKGLVSEEDLEREKQSSNQIIITSSGYFTFNHMYPLYCAYKKEMLAGNSKYAAFRVPYNFLPEGFLDMENIESSRRQMSSLEFRMEYGAEFIPDTEAFYKASLLDICSRTNFQPQVVGSPEKKYCLGIDPARSEDSFAIAVAELDRPAKLVHALEYQKVPFPEMAAIVERLCVDFNVESIYIDSQGGGWAIKDILAENRSGDARGPILDPEDEVHQLKSGRHILKMCNPSVDFIAQSNFFALALLEHRNLLFPSVPTGEQPSALQDEAWQVIQKMKGQMQAIEHTETPTGKQHFDVPKGEGHGKQKKDLYSAFMLVARAVYDSLWAEQMPESILHHGGLMNVRDGSSANLPGDPALGKSAFSVPQALRDKLEIARDPEGFKRRMLQDGMSKRTNLYSPAAVLKPKPKKRG